MASLWKIFLVFAKIGAFSIGGGIPMIAAIKSELVERKWLNDEDFVDIITLAQTAPGLFAVNISILTGHKLRGTKGSVVATIASCLPPFLIILMVAMFFTEFKDNEYVIKAFKGIRPVVVALIGVPMIDMIKATKMRWWSWIIVFSSMILVCFLKVSPIYLLICVIVVAAFISWHNNRKIPDQTGNGNGKDRELEKEENTRQERSDMIFFELFSTFFIIGMFTIGGGYAMLSLIQNEVVTVHGWIDETTFTDIVAISQMTPGPIGINSATYIGYEVLAKTGASEFLCILGSTTATFAVVLPSFIIVLAICRVYDYWKNHYMFQGVMSGLKPATLGLIGTAALGLATPENFIDWKSYVLCISAFIALYFKKLGPFSVIGIGALAGLLIY